MIKVPTECLNSCVLFANCLYRQDEDTALIRAVLNGKADCSRVLLESGANPDAKNDVRLIFIMRSRIRSCIS